jgi:tryptophanyl-tRNA synthetase
VKRSLTGIKPTGNIHIGNWLGSIRPAMELARTYDAFYFIADYHAMTTLTDGPTLRRHTLETAASWLAFGLDPKRTLMFRQSAVPEVAELAWILSCQMPVGMLERGHAVKAAKDDNREINAGLMYYPVLMAADILLYDSNVVPVGKDQKQHVEIARDVAQKVNFLWGDDTLVVPDVLIQEDAAVVPGLDGRKMSKSYGNEIGLWLSSKELKKRIGRIVSDSTPMEAPKNPETDTTFALFKAVAPPDRTEDLRQRYLRGGIGYGHAKQELFEVMDALLAEPRDRYHSWLAEPARIEEVLEDGARRARVEAERTLSRVRERAGVTPLK